MQAAPARRATISSSLAQNDFIVGFLRKALRRFPDEGWGSIRQMSAARAGKNPRMAQKKARLLKAGLGERSKISELTSSFLLLFSLRASAKLPPIHDFPEHLAGATRWGIWHHCHYM
ncbi:MAG: hypothetical protein ACRD11_01995 [Terriglobia bacterium]